MSIDLKLYGAYGLSGFMMLVGYLFYDKSTQWSAVLEFCGIILACWLIFAYKK